MRIGGLSLRERKTRAARCGIRGHTWTTLAPIEWLHKPVSDREQENSRLMELIRDSYAASRDVYGALRVFGDLREAGETCGKHRVASPDAAPIRSRPKAPRPIAGEALDHRAQPAQPRVQRRRP